MIFEVLVIVAVATVAVILGIVLASLLVGRNSPANAPSGGGCPVQLDLIVADGKWFLYARKTQGSGYWSTIARQWQVRATQHDGEVIVLAAGEWTYDFRWQSIRELAHGPLTEDITAVSAQADTGMLGTLTVERTIAGAR